MTLSERARTSGSIGFFLIVVVSAALMLWMLWHFPWITAAVTLGTFAAFGIAARLARWIDSEGRVELETHKRRI